MQQLSIGATLQNGKYRIERVLGQGGFGITYLARHTMLDTHVAIKEFFPKDFCDRDDTTSHVTLGTSNTAELVSKLKSKFIKEAKNIAKLHHPNIVSIQDIFEENNTAYYIMGYVEGISLGDIIKKDGAMNEWVALKFIREVCDAISYMHSKSMNHLDIKPGNIMVQTIDNKPILIDFGTSKQYDSEGDQTSTMAPGFTHGYAPVEQYKPGGVSTFTPQTDIYALGATLFALLTGEKPPHYSEILEDGLPEFSSSISERTAKAVEHAMEIRKNKRPATIEVFLSELPSEESGVTEQKDSTPKYQASVEPQHENESVATVSEETVFAVPSSSSNSVSDTFSKANIEKLTSEIKSMYEPVSEPVEAPETDTLIINGIEFVDLGLSVRWANMNIGAESPREVGSFISKKVDNDINDVYEYNLKGAKVPTIGQWEELKNQCSWEWTELSGSGGYMVHGKNGNSIFLPFSGDSADMNFRTFGRLFTRETVYRNGSGIDQYYFYYAHGGTYKCTKYSKDYTCPVRLVY
jgi:serine/threonine protein kinase